VKLDTEDLVFFTTKDFINQQQETISNALQSSRLQNKVSLEECTDHELH